MNDFICSKCYHFSIQPFPILRATHMNGHIDARTSTHRPSNEVDVQSALSLSITIYSVYCGCLSYLKSRETEEKKKKYNNYFERNVIIMIQYALMGMRMRTVIFMSGRHNIQKQYAHNEM